MPTTTDSDTEQECGCEFCDASASQTKDYCGHCLARGCHDDDPGVLRCDAALPGDWSREVVRIGFELFSTHYDRQKQSVAVFVPADVASDVEGTPDDGDAIWVALGAAGYGETGTPPTFADGVDREGAREAAIEEMGRVEALRGEQGDHGSADGAVRDSAGDTDGKCHKCGAPAVTSTFDGALRCAECIDAENNPDRTPRRVVGQTGLGDFL